MHSKPKKSLGQNFLIDKNILNKILTYSCPKKDERILEIGPGRGELTGLLIKHAKEVIAVEIDTNLCEQLGRKFKDCANLTLINKDILKLKISGYKRLKVIANIPYYITTPIISYLLKNKNALSQIFITVQKEYAMRLKAKPKETSYGALSCFAQYFTRPALLFSIKNTSFRPMPRVNSSFVRLEILPTPSVKVKDEAVFFKLIRNAFNQRRKQIKNSLSKMLPQEEIQRIFKNLHINPGIRAEELSLSDFAAITNSLTPQKRKKIINET